MLKFIVTVAVGFLSIAAGNAATVITTGTFSGSALAYDPTKDFSPGSGYVPPAKLGGYNGLITLAGFDTALGTLNSVTISEHAETSLEYKQAYPYTTAEVIKASVFASGQSPYGDADISLPYTFSNTGLTPLQPYDTGVQLNNSVPGLPYTNIFPSTFAPFLNKNVYVPVLAYVNFGPATGGSYLGQPTSSFSYTMTFAYDYTPNATAAVPEVATWVMMIGGFAMMGAVVRRRRTVYRPVAGQL